MSEPFVGIEIRNLPVRLTKEELYDIFSSRLDDGNKVKYLLYPIPGNIGKAFVCFKQSPGARFVETLLEQNPLWSIKLDSRIQVYSTCTAEVNSLIVASVPNIEDCIRMLEKSYGVTADYSENSGKLVLRGSLQQLLCAQEKLNSISDEQIALQNLGLMSVGRWNTPEPREFHRSDDGALQNISHGIASSRVPDESVFERRDFVSSRSVNENDLGLTYRDDVSELRRMELEGVAGIGKSMVISGPQSLPCLTETKLEEKDLSWKTPFKHDSKNHFVISSGFDQRKVSRDKKDEKDEDYREMLSEEPQDYKSGFGVSSDVSVSGLGSVTRGDTNGDRLITKKTKVSATSAVQPDKYPGSSDIACYGKVSSATEDIFTSGSASLPPFSYTSADTFGSSHKNTQHRHVKTRGSYGGFKTDARASGFSPEAAAEYEPRGNDQQNSAMQESLFLEFFVVYYIFTIEEARVNDIAKRYSVNIKADITHGSDIAEVIFTGLRFCKPEDLKRALEKFTKLYEDIFNDIIQRDVRCDCAVAEIAAALKRIEMFLGDRVILITDNPGVVTAVGEFKEVMKALDMLNEAKSKAEKGSQFDAFSSNNTSGGLMRKELTDEEEIEDGNDDDEDTEKKSTASHLIDAAITSDSGEQRRSVSDRSSSPTPNELTKGDYLSTVRTKRNRSELGAVPSTTFFHVTFHEIFHVYNYTDDLTRVRVHAIVNAANSSLNNYGGVAAAIEKAGGSMFEKDCDQLIKSHGPLKVSEVLHTAGRGELQCAFVIHTVGPQWYSEKDENECFCDLKVTFKNVLEYADTVLRVASVAVPPVGTGVFGVPLDVCARALYFAVAEFVQNRPLDLPLKFLHIVSKDPGTTELIQAVFEGLQLTAQDEGEGEVQPKVEDGNTSVDQLAVADTGLTE